MSLKGGAIYYLLWLVLVAILLLHASCHVECCVEEERLALLEIKAYLKSYIDQNPLYADTDEPWSENGQTYNCCAWDMVECDVSTRLVTRLDLSGMVYFAEDPTEKPWLFNVTLFRPFKQLIDLNLLQISTNGLVENDGSTNITTLKNLQFLSLGPTNLQAGSFSVGALSSLKNLTLVNCEGSRESTFLSQDLPNLRELQALDLRGNGFHVPVKELLGHLANPEALQVLNLGDNHFYGSMQGFCKLRNIKELHLQDNLLSGNVPSCIKDLLSLQVLDVTNNHLRGEFSLTSLTNLSDLQQLRFSRNRLVLRMGDSSWRPKLQLQSLHLGGCTLNMTYKTISKFLLNQTNLIELDLSHSNPFEAFPTWLLHKTSKLKALYLANNSFSGSFQLPHAVNLSLLSLSISGNNFHGNVPKDFGLVFPQLEYLNLSMNHFEGHIPPSLGNMRGLRYLDLSNNNFSGELPRHLLSDCNFLEVLQVSNNNLQGEVMTKNMNLPFLNWLKLSNNRFSGRINNGLRKSIYLNYFDVSNNNITGSLPRWIGDLSYLETLSMSGNNLQGHIPIEICKLRLVFLDLSQNDFSGFIPSCSGFSSLEFLHLHLNNLTGPIPNALSGCSSLKTLDLSNNRLEGGIPLWINKLSSLSVLLLAGNTLHGLIPHQLCQLHNINLLDLSRNNLHGQVPTCTANMSFGRKIISSSTYYQVIITPILDDDDIEYSLDDSSMLEQHSLPEEVEFLEKNGYLSYVGDVLGLMSGLDLSCNNLTGVIPSELGNLAHVHSVNFSHNLFFGSIPSGFSNLKQVESLDLSFNNLSGVIPSELVDLNFLEIFNVSYNNLTGSVPETGQFASFDERNYLGNPRLCGLPMNKSCNRANELPPHSLTKEDDDDGKKRMDMIDFFWSFGMSCVTMFLASNVILCINPQWRQTWFDYVDFHVLWWLPTL